MNGFLDHLLVGVALIGAFGYAGYALGPRALRRRLARGIAATLARLPAFMRLRGTAQRFAASADKASGACGGCDTCGSAPAASGGASASAAAPPAAARASASARVSAASGPSTSASANSSEVTIAVSAIGRRQSTRLQAPR